MVLHIISNYLVIGKNINARPKLVQAFPKVGLANHHTIN